MRSSKMRQHRRVVSLVDNLPPLAGLRYGNVLTDRPSNHKIAGRN